MKEPPGPTASIPAEHCAQPVRLGRSTLEVRADHFALGKQPTQVAVHAGCRSISSPRCSGQGAAKSFAASVRMASRPGATSPGSDPTSSASSANWSAKAGIAIEQHPPEAAERGVDLVDFAAFCPLLAPHGALWHVPAEFESVPPGTRGCQADALPGGGWTAQEKSIGPYRDEVWRHVRRQCRADPAGRAPREARGRRRQSGVGRGLGHVGQDQRARRLGQRGSASCTMRANTTPSSPRASRSPPA